MIPTPPSSSKRPPFIYLNKKMIKETKSSKVYKAYQLFKKEKKEVVIKYIPIQGKNKQIDLEVEIQNSLSNRYIMPLIDDFEIQNKFRVLVMKEGLGTLISGYDKDDNFFKSLPQLYKIMYQIAKGVRYLHKNNILHGDIKPLNILVMNDDEYMPLVQIIDFGFSVHLPPYDGTEATCCKCKKISLSFSAPELHKSAPHSYPSDIWSLGATFYYIITQEAIPFNIYLGYDQIARELEENVDKIQYDKRYGPQFPESGKNLIRQMLDKDPSARPTIKDVLKSDFFKEVLDDRWLAEEQMLEGMTVPNDTIEQTLSVADDDDDNE